MDTTKPNAAPAQPIAPNPSTAQPAPGQPMPAQGQQPAWDAKPAVGNFGHKPGAEAQPTPRAPLQRDAHASMGPQLTEGERVQRNIDATARSASSRLTDQGPLPPSDAEKSDAEREREAAARRAAAEHDDDEDAAIANGAAANRGTTKGPQPSAPARSAAARR